MELKLDDNTWQLIYLMPTEWVWRKAWQEDWDPMAAPAAGQWINACVPGDVIADALDAGLIKSPYVDLQSREAEWLSERDWVYRKEFVLPPEMCGKTVRLCFDGVDYTCHVYLNSEPLGKHEGMFTHFGYDITARLREDKPNVLVVIVEHKPPVEAVQGQIGWSSAARIWKSRFAYNWDWCTRLAPVGIWQSVRLVATAADFLQDVWGHSQVTDTHANVTVNVKLQASENARDDHIVRLRCRILSPSGVAIGDDIEINTPVSGRAGTAEFHLEIENPQLWFPNGMGEQPLYSAQVDILGEERTVTDGRAVRFGLRTIRAVANAGAPPDALPYTLEVNGKKVFVKGWNWAPIDNLYGRPQLDRYERLLSLARHAHCNLLRVWGGGLLEREEFYNLCDQYGILIWQEFHHSSSGIDNRPPDDKEYLDYIEHQARQMVPLRRNHPSLAIWCGGNELMDDSFTPLTDAHPALARLKAIVNELDPDRLWLPTSSSGPVESADPKLTGTDKMHDVHGPWQYQGPEDHYRFYNNIDALYHSEFGAEGAANLNTLQRFISPRYQWPPDATNAAWVHHGSWWLHREKLEGMFGKLDTLESFIRASQWMQAEGLRYAIESNRRRKWRCSGASPWQLNEAFPNTACTNAVDYLGLTKPAYWWIRRAYEPLHISAKYERVAWPAGSTWRAEFWCNNSMTAMPGARWEARLCALAGDVVAQADGIADLSDDSAVRLGTLEYQLGDTDAQYVLWLSLFSPGGNPLSRNEYLFATGKPPFEGLLQAPSTELTVGRHKDKVDVRNTGNFTALFIQCMPAAAQWILPSDDYFCLAPGEGRTVHIEGKGKIDIKAWNTGTHRIIIR